MNPTSPSLRPPPLARSRTLVHPGPFNPLRIQSRHCDRSRHFRLALQPGLSLHDALVKPLANLGVSSASVTLLGGHFDNLEFCVAQPDPSGRALIAYTRPIQAGRAFMIFGNATLGKDAQDRPVVHCHAALRTEEGDIRGGHIVPQSCRVSGEPVTVLVTALEGFELRVTFDAETNMSLLQPQPLAHHE